MKLIHVGVVAAAWLTKVNTCPCDAVVGMTD